MMKRNLFIVVLGLLLLQLIPYKSNATEEGFVPPSVSQPVSAMEQIKVEELPEVEPKAVPVASPTPVQSGGNCEAWMAEAGIPLTAATQKLILNESGCRTAALNPTSGACGIPQALPCSKLPCPLNDTGAVCQLRWMDSYVKGRYGSWDNALTTWYSRCPSAAGCWY